MSSNKEGIALVGVAAVACAACCAGPILGFLAAIGLGTVVGVALFGSVALFVGAVVAGWVIVRRRRRALAAKRQPPGSEPVAIRALRG
jgi:hypothetical protein